MKKALSFVLLFALVASLTGCQVGDISDPNTRIITDTAGREVAVPETVERIVTLGSGAPRLAAYLGVMDLLAGAEDHDIEGMTVLRDYSPVHQAQLAALPSVGAGGGSGANNGYPESILQAAPQVILAGFSAEAADELQKQTGIPVVCVRYTSKGLANDTFDKALYVFAMTVGKLERYYELMDYIRLCKEDLDDRTKEIPEGEKPRVYTGAVTFSGQHGFAGTYSRFGPLDAVNAVNVADLSGEDGYYEVDPEKVLNWDPDVIFLDPGNLHLVREEYRKNPDYFETLRAVQEGRVYTMPSFNNCGMNISYALINAYYAGIVLYPEAFSDVDIAEKGSQILRMFLGENTFDTMAQGGLYYGTISIGG